MTKKRYGILQIIVITILSSLCLLIGCDINYDDCYTCQKESGGYWSSMGWVTEYKTKLACSDKEANKLRKDGWNCYKDQSQSVNIIGPDADNAEAKIYTSKDTTCQCDQ